MTMLVLRRARLETVHSHSDKYIDLSILQKMRETFSDTVLEASHSLGFHAIRSIGEGRKIITNLDNGLVMYIYLACPQA